MVELTREQLYLFELAKNNSRSFFGQQIKAEWEMNGTRIESEIFGTIIGITQPPQVYNDAVFTCEWETGEVYNYPIFVFSPVGLKVPKSFDPIKLEKKKMVEKLSTRFSALRKQEFDQIDSRITNLTREKTGIEASLKSYEERNKKVVEDLADLMKKKLDAPKEFTDKDFLREISMIKKLDKVESVGVDKNGSIYITTKELHPIVLNTKNIEKENLKQSIGSYLIVLNVENYIHIHNLTYLSHGMAHPHVHNGGGSICFGENGTTVNNLLLYGQYFFLADFIITFLSAWRQLHASPFMPYGEWMSDKEKRTDPYKPPIFLEL